MPTTTLGITYPDSSGNTNLWTHLQNLAEDVDDLITTDRTARDAAYSAYTPTMTAQSGGSPAIGNGTASGRYIQQGKRVHGMFSLAVGSTTSFGSGITFWATPAAHHSGWNSLQIGTAYLFDNSGSARRIAGVILDSSNQRCYLVNASDGNIITASAPWTWANNDLVRAVFAYEAA